MSFQRVDTITLQAAHSLARSNYCFGGGGRRSPLNVRHARGSDGGDDTNEDPRPWDNLCNHMVTHRSVVSEKACAIAEAIVSLPHPLAQWCACQHTVSISVSRKDDSDARFSGKRGAAVNWTVSSPWVTCVSVNVGTELDSPKIACVVNAESVQW